MEPELRSEGKKTRAAKHERHDLEAVLETVRALWTAADQSDPQVQAWLQKAVVDGVERIKRQVQGRLKMAAIMATPRQAAKPPGSVKPPNVDNKEQTQSAPAKQIPLFEEDRAAEPEQPPVPAAPGAATSPAADRFPEAPLRIYTKDLVSQASKFVPKAAAFPDLAAYRTFLSDKLPFNAVATRRRNANYLISRFFPGETLHRDLVAFAAAADGHRALGDVLFYLVCRTEKMVAQVAEQLVWPSLAEGGVPRSRLQDYVEAHFPQFKSGHEVSSAIVRTYTGFGVGAATRTRLNVAQRQGHLAAFVYILHLEYPEPGMYSFEKLLDGPMHKWLLWDRKWIVDQLYLARHAKLLPKISEIDSLRQFTTKYPLAEAVDRIVPLLKEDQP